MHFEIAHEFDIPLDALELAVISPDLVDKFGATVQEHGRRHRDDHRAKPQSFNNGVLERVWHYQAHIRLPKFARGYVTPEMTAWDEQSVYEMGRTAGAGPSCRTSSRSGGKYFSATGTYAIEPLGDGRSRRDGAGRARAARARGAPGGRAAHRGRGEKAFEAEAATLRDMATLV